MEARILKQIQWCFISVTLIGFLATFHLFLNDEDNDDSVVPKFSLYDNFQSTEPEDESTTFQDIPTTPSIPTTSSIPSCPSQPILTMVKGGRLGNLIGTYATLYVFSRRYPGYLTVVPQLVLDELNKVFQNLSLSTANTIPEHCEFEYYSGFPTHRSLREKVDVQLPQYMVSVQLAFNHRSKVLQEFQFRADISEAARQLIDDIRQKRQVKTVIGVHIRRTDYPKFVKKRWNETLVDHGYIHQAMEVFTVNLESTPENKYVFLVISDDLAYCKENLDSNRYPIEFGSEGQNAGVDMATLAQTDGLIITMGTYGFWSAFFNQKTIVYPSQQNLIMNIGNKNQHGWIQLQ